MGDLKTLAKMGFLVLGGFFLHKGITGGIIRALTSTDASTGAMTFASLPMIGADGKPTVLATWQKPLVGGLFGGLGIFGISKLPMKSDTRNALSAGVVTSFLQSLVHTILTVANQPEVLSYLEGYQNSAAYSLRGTRGKRRRHPMRGLGVARNATSIMPHYAPVGQFQQAAAGMGEYFAAQSGMGEYFAGPGVEGVGHYEKAGPLALQPSTSRMGNLPIDDGIRPDSNLDHVMDLAESAAGLGQGFRQAAAGVGAGPGYRQAAAGMGEYFSAAPQDGGYKEFSVPTQSQWIPSGPLWAGTMSADAAYTESELPAGILQGPGGNGVLSG
jgi:hypothetical protein